MLTNFTPENAEFFICESCDFKCCKKSDFNRHLLTSKHQNADKCLQKSVLIHSKNLNKNVCVPMSNKTGFMQLMDNITGRDQLNNIISFHFSQTNISNILFIVLNSVKYCHHLIYIINT